MVTLSRCLDKSSKSTTALKLDGNKVKHGLKLSTCGQKHSFTTSCSLALVLELGYKLDKVSMNVLSGIYVHTNLLGECTCVVGYGCGSVPLPLD